MSAEIWKPIASAAGYEVSNQGRVRGLPRVVLRKGRPMRIQGRLIASQFVASGHVYISIRSPLKNRTTPVHTLVLLAFAGPRLRGQQARHLNGNPADNRWPENLEWSTKGRNEQDKKWHRMPHSRKIDPKAAANIKRLMRRKDRHTAARLAGQYDVSTATIYNVAKGLTHKDVGG